MSKVTAYNVGRILDKTYSAKSYSTQDSMDGLMEELMTNTEKFRAPFSYGETFCFQESLPIYGVSSFKEGSDMHNILSDKYGEVGLVVDSVLSSIDSLHFVTMATTSSLRDLVQEWLYMMSSYDILVRQIKAKYTTSDYVVISKLSSFIKND